MVDGVHRGNNVGGPGLPIPLQFSPLGPVAGNVRLQMLLGVRNHDSNDAARLKSAMKLQQALRHIVKKIQMLDDVFREYAPRATPFQGQGPANVVREEDVAMRRSRVDVHPAVPAGSAAADID